MIIRDQRTSGGEGRDGSDEGSGDGEELHFVGWIWVFDLEV